MTKVAVLIGSLRQNSSNKALVKNLEKVAPSGMQFEYVDIRVPLYSEDIENAGIPAEVQKLKAAIEAADGVLVATPEYNRGVPGVLKNAIDWASRPHGQTSFAHKPVGIVGSSMGIAGTAVAQAELRPILLYQNAKVLGQPEIYVAYAHEVFDEAGNVRSERWNDNFRAYMEAFQAWVEAG